ncbi:hypothetical protein ACTS95_10380 [Empedobacter brevis]
MIKLFREKEISDYFVIVGRNILSKVDNISEAELLNNEVNDLATKILAPLKLKHLEIDFKSRTAESNMIEIPASNFPRDYDVRAGQKYPCVRVSYTYDVSSNNIELLSVAPASFIISKVVNTSVDQKDFTIHYNTLYQNINLSDEIKKEIKNWVTSVEEEMVEIVKAINKEIDDFNIEILYLLKSNIENKKNKTSHKKDQDIDLNNF